MRVVACSVIYGSLCHQDTQIWPTARFAVNVRHLAVHAQRNSFVPLFLERPVLGQLRLIALNGRQRMRLTHGSHIELHVRGSLAH